MICECFAVKTAGNFNLRLSAFFTGISMGVFQVGLTGHDGGSAKAVCCVHGMVQLVCHYLQEGQQVRQ